MVSIPSYGDYCLLSRYVNNIQDHIKKLSIMAGFNEWWWKQYSHLFKELLVEIASTSLIKFDESSINLCICVLCLS